MPPWLYFVVPRLCVVNFPMLWPGRLRSPVRNGPSYLSAVTLKEGLRASIADALTRGVYYAEDNANYEGTFYYPYGAEWLATPLEPESTTLLAYGTFQSTLTCSPRSAH